MTELHPAYEELLAHGWEIVEERINVKVLADPRNPNVRYVCGWDSKAQRWRVVDREVST